MGKNRNCLLWFFMVVLLFQGPEKGVQGLAINWGTRSTYPLPLNIVVKLLKDNGFDKVKLVEAEPGALKALGRTGIQVVVGIPNDLLAPLASSVTNTVNWVQQNVSNNISRYGTNISYVAVGNEPFLKTYKNEFVSTTFPALQNIQAALIKAAITKQMKVTIPLNADVYQSDSGLLSGGNFRVDIRDLMINIIKFLRDNNGVLTINIYPFLSLYADPNFPKEYAYFDNSAIPLQDGLIAYTNVYDANFDTLISALEKNGFGSMPVVIGEVGWPTDGDPNANAKNAQRFNQGLLNRIIQGQGTPKRPTPTDVYIFYLIDEDNKSVGPDNFERHCGIFNYDGTVKYQLNLVGGKSLVPAKRRPLFSEAVVHYVASGKHIGSQLAGQHQLRLPVRRLHESRIRVVVRQPRCATQCFLCIQRVLPDHNQSKDSCNFSGLAAISTTDPSQGSCHFEIMIDLGKHKQASGSSSPAAMRVRNVVAAALTVMAALVLLCGVFLPSSTAAV